MRWANADIQFQLILKPLTTNEFTVKDSFRFAEEIVDQQHDLFMGNLDVDSLFTNIPLEETIEICTNELFKESETVEGLSKTEFKELLSLATKDSHFIFDETNRWCGYGFPPRPYIS